MSKKNPNVINPLAAIFKFLQQKARVQLWLYENTELRLEGRIVGFDEYMNIVLDEAVEVNTKSKQSHQIGKIMLKGENVTLIRSINDVVM